MRTLIVIVMVVVGLAGMGSAAASQGTVDEISGLTLDQAAAKFGAPSYEHRCQDGTKTVAWKRAVEATSTGSVIHTVRDYNGRAAEPKTTLVAKFDATGRLAWARAIR